MDPIEQMMGMAGLAGQQQQLPQQLADQEGGLPPELAGLLLQALMGMQGGPQAPGGMPPPGMGPPGMGQPPNQMGGMGGGLMQALGGGGMPQAPQYGGR